MIDDSVLIDLGCHPRWRPMLNDSFGLWGIDTEQRISYFMAQALYETDGFQRLAAPLNLGPQSILEAWPHTFSADDAVAMAHDPERIANRAYAGAHGNGDEASGDGYRYRPRGLLMLAGRNMYKACGAGLGVSLLNEPELAEEPIYAALTGAWLFAASGCNELADARNFAGCTRRLSGSIVDLEDRVFWLGRAKAALGLPR